jgi:hypothetical protein
MSEMTKKTESESYRKIEPTVLFSTLVCTAEPVFVNVYGAQESLPRNRFRQPM